ncbi:MAG: hypothetical protein ACRETW_03690 [Stenotrophobium sp.]
MASGKLGSGVATNGTPALAYTCPAATTATANIRVVNDNAFSVAVRVSIGANPPTAADMFEPDVVIAPNGVMLDTGEAIGAGENVVITVNTAGASVSFRVSGYEGAQ